MKKIILFILIILGLAGGCYYYSIRVQKSDATPSQANPDSSGQPAEVAKPIPKTSFAFAGDMMFDRNVWHKYKDLGLNHLFDNLDVSVFKNADISFANLEGPISAAPINDDYASGSMVFNFPPETIETLKYLGLNSVSLANNHTLNAGAKGFANTQSVLGAAGIKFVGNQNDFDSENILRLETEIPVTIIAVDMLVDIDNSQIVSSITGEVEAGRTVFVVPHWGVEYEDLHHPSQERLAKSWVDAGAVMVIGGHPHVVQDVQVYNNRPIVYSLGNFVFDQFFSPETQQGLIISGDIEGSNLTLRFSPFTSTNVKPSLDTGSVKASRLKQIFPDTPEFSALKIADDSIKIDLSK